MTIEFYCACGQKLKAPDDAAGRKARCPACKADVRIPAGPPDGSPASVGTEEAAAQKPSGAAAPPPGPASAGGPVVATCPHCRTEMDVPPSLVGRSVRCPQCSGQFQAPAAGGAPADAYPPAPSTRFGPPPAPYAPAGKGAYGFGPAPIYPPQAPPYGYGYGYGYPGYVTSAPGAVASLVCGILSIPTLCFGIVLGIIAIAQGSAARRALAMNPGAYSGGGMATAGTVTGIIGLCFGCLYLFAVMLSRC
jgi:hypothetical protein